MGKFSQIDDIFSGDFNPTEMMQLAEDIDLSEWAGHNLQLQETEAQRQKYTRDLTVQGEQILRDLNNERRFEEAGVPRKKMPGRGQRMQNVLGTLRSDNGEIVGPFRESGFKKGNRYERRWYTQESESPLIKGYKEVIPFENPETGKPLTTMFADRNKVEFPELQLDERWGEPTLKGFRIGPRQGKDLGQQGELATELVTKHAAWLAGGEFSGIRSANDSTIEDFRNARTFPEFREAYYKRLGHDYEGPGGKKYDAEMLRNPNQGGTAQIHTGIVSENRNPYYDIVNSSKRVGLQDAPEAAGYRAMPGKTSVEKNYTILQPEWTGEYGDRNKAPAEVWRQDKITEPPEAFRVIKPEKVRAELDRLGPRLPKEQIGVSPTQKGQYKTTWKIPKGSPAVEDLSGTGNVPQILKNLDYVQAPEAPTPVKSVVKTVKNIAKNPAVRMAGVALGAIPVLGDAADATTGTIDTITETGDKQVRGAGNAVAGMTGLAAVAAPAAAPVLAPVSIGLGVGNMAADWTKERRSKDKKYTINAPLTSKHIHTPEAPVTIQAPSAAQIVSETQRRRNARRSTGGPVAKPAKPTTAGGWWNKALDAVKNFGK